MNHDRATPDSTASSTTPGHGSHRGLPGSGYLPRRSDLDLHLRVGPHLLPVRRLGVVDVEVSLPPGVLPPEVGPLEVTLQGAGLILGPVPAHLDAEAASEPGRLCLRLAPSLDTGRALLGLARTLALNGSLVVPGSRSLPAEIITDPGRIRRLMGALVGARAPARLMARDHRAGAGGQAAAFEADTERPLRWTVDSDPGGPEIEIRVEGYTSSFAFRVQAAPLEAGVLATTEPERVLRTRTRRCHRSPAPPGARLRFWHPVWPEIEVRRPLADLALGGLGFASEGIRDALWPGLVLPEIDLCLPGQPPLKLAGVVRHVSDDGRDRGQVCGLELQGELEPWHRAIEPHLYPRTHRAGADHDLWDLYARSGYFNISGKDPTAFEEVRAAFTATNQAIARAPDVAYHVVWPSPRGLEASTTVARPYSGTWVGYQLARRPDTLPEPLTAREILRGIMLHSLEYAQRDRDFAWFVVWLPAHARFSRHVAHELTSRWLHETELAAIVPLHVYEGRCATPVTGAAAAFEVGPATDDELDALVARVRAVRGGPYAEAHDLVPERLALGRVREIWARRGFARERRITIARHHGVPVAAAINEVAEDGIHLFGLFDAVRLLAFTPEGMAAYPTLLEAARHWYREQGKEKFVLFLEDDWPGVADTGLADLGAADTTILSADLYPDQLEHLWEITAPRIAPVDPERSEDDHR